MGSKLCVRKGRMPMRTTIGNIENIVRAFVMVVPMLGVKLLSVYEVTMISGGKLYVYYLLIISQAAPFTLGLLRPLILEYPVQ